MTTRPRAMGAAHPRSAVHAFNRSMCVDDNRRATLMRAGGRCKRAMSEVRNPIIGVTVTLAKSLGYGLLACIPLVLLPVLVGVRLPFELQLLYFGFAFFFIGVFAGRASIVG